MPQKGSKMSKRLITFAFYAKAAVYLTLAVISIIVGGFFAYLGFTGSWDVITILFSLSGLIGVGMVATLLPLLSQGVPRDVYNPGRAVVPLWSEGEPEFDGSVSSEENPTDPFEARREKAKLHPPMHFDHATIRVYTCDFGVEVNRGDTLVMEIRRVRPWMDEVWVINSDDNTLYTSSEIEKLISSLLVPNADARPYIVFADGCTDHGPISTMWRTR